MGSHFRALNLFVKLDVAIIVQAKLDLIRISDRNCLQAAMYFFLDSARVDEKLQKTFTHLCTRNGIDPERAAKGIWNQLAPHQKNRVLRLLEEAGLRQTKTVN